MAEDCKTCSEKQVCVPYFAHESTVTHMATANRRLLVALIVSLTVMMIGFVILGYMFLTSYNDREKGWQDIIQQRTTEVTDGTQQQTPP